MDIIAAVQTLTDQNLHYQQKCKNLEQMETMLRKALVDYQVEIEVLKEKIRRLETERRATEIMKGE